MRLIDADELIKHECEADRMGAMLVVGKGYIFSAPTVDPAKHSEWTGNWISCDEDLDGYFDGYKCLECMEVSLERYPYCPYCGAKMDKE